MNNTIFEQVDAYISKLTGGEDDILKQSLVRMAQAGLPEISVSPNQGKFLQVLAKLVNASRILEIGTLGGYSTIWMARALPPGGKLITLELDPLHAAVAKTNFEHAGLDDLIEQRTGKALELLQLLKAENLPPFDMIFIDADKPPYAEYFEWSLKLSRPGTLIVADNVIRDGQVLDLATTDEKVRGAQRFNEMLGANENITATIIQTVGSKEHDGMGIAIVK